MVFARALKCALFFLEIFFLIFLNCAFFLLGNSERWRVAGICAPFASVGRKRTFGLFLVRPTALKRLLTRGELVAG